MSSDEFSKVGHMSSASNFSLRCPSVVKNPICLGIILVSGQLRQRLEDAADQRLSQPEIDGVMNDCNDLIIEFMRAEHQRQGESGVTPRIDEATRSQFAAFDLSIEVRPELLATSGAVQVR